MSIRFNWGMGVTLVYAAFAAGTLSMVALASSTHVDLVSDDYYARSLTVDQRLAATALGEEAVADLGIVTSPDHSPALAIHFRVPPGSDSRGTLTWYRPSSSGADRTVSLTAEALTAPISLAGLAGGRWRAQVQWTSDGRDHYVEREVDIP
jgi:hypothetical protein